MRRLVLLAAVSATAVLLLLPSGASAAGIISSLSVDPSQVRDGATATGTVDLAFPSDGDTTVLLFSGDTSVATVPASVVVLRFASSPFFGVPSFAMVFRPLQAARQRRSARAGGISLLGTMGGRLEAFGVVQSLSAVVQPLITWTTSAALRCATRRGGSARDLPGSSRPRRAGPSRRPRPASACG